MRFCFTVIHKDKRITRNQLKIFMKKLLLLPVVAALLAACSSTSATFTEDVTIDSLPQGADVFLNGEVIGQTPMMATLPKDGVYELRIAKKGYKDEVVNVASQRSNPLVKFGPLVDLGYYKQLSPSPVESCMKPDFLPEYPGTNAFGQMTANILKADDMRKTGEINAEEHSYLIKTISEFYMGSK